MNEIKISFQDKLKRVNEPVRSFLQLNRIIHKLFNIEDSQYIKVYYLDSDSDKIEVSSDSEFFKIADYHKTRETTAKFEVVQSSLRNANDISDILNSVKLSESVIRSDSNSDKNPNGIPRSHNHFDLLAQNSYENINRDLAKEKRVSNKKNSTVDNCSGTCVEYNNVGINTAKNETNHVGTQHEKVTSENDDKDNKMLSKINELLNGKLNEMQIQLSKLVVEESDKNISKLESNIKNQLQFENSQNFDLLCSRKRPQNSVEIISHNIEFASNREDELSISNSNLQDDQCFVGEFCSICNKQIKADKFICIMCENFSICQACEKTHLYHPLLKVNKSSSLISDRDDLVQYINKNLPIKNPCVLRKISKSSSRARDHITINPYSQIKTTFAMIPKETLVFTVRIQHNCEEPLSNLLIYPKNSKNFQVSSSSIRHLDMYDSSDVDITLKAPAQKGNYSFELTAMIKNFNLIVEPLKFQISVVDPNAVDELNINILFSDFEDIKDLPLGKKRIIYNIFKKNISSKSIPQIAKILRDNNYKIESSLELLTNNDSILSKILNSGTEVDDMMYVNI